MTREITLQEYIKLIFLFYQFIYPHERNIQSTFPALLNGREKSRLLLADLSELQASHSNPGSCGEAALTMSTETDIYGYLYVMEGSTLGGQVITHALKQNPNLPHNLKTYYFNAYGHETRRKWLDFTHILCEKNVTPTQHDQVVKSAVITFTALLHWLQGNI
jgi:heme oxygenase